MKILILTKRQYMSKDLLNDRFGRFREIPLSLADMGHRVTGLCLSYKNLPQGWVKDGPVQWKSVNATPLKFPGLLRFIATAMRLTRDADMIWACSDSFYGVIACFLGKLNNVRVVFDLYDNFGEFLAAKLPFAKQLYHWALRNSDAITCLSKSFARHIQKEFHVPGERIHPVEFAVKPDIFKPLSRQVCRKNLGLPEHATIIGTAGALFMIRDVHLLIEAFCSLRQHHPELHIALAGPQDGHIRIPDDSHVHYLGVLPFNKVPLFMNSLDIAIVCYADDNFGKYCFPQKTREFMACDVPLVAAGVGSLKELFKEHPDWLYEPGDSSSLAKAIELRLINRQTGYPPVPTWDDLAKQLEQIMLNLLNAPA